MFYNLYYRFWGIVEFLVKELREFLMEEIFMNLIFDTHAHYDDHAFDDDRESLLDKLFAEEVCCIVNQGTDLETSKFSLELAGKYEGMYAAVGMHPEYLTEESLKGIDEIYSLAKNKKAVAVGEIGLDYHYDVSHELQKKVFIKHLEIALSLDMPVTIHDREAHGDILEIIKKYKPKGILHCFSGSVEMAREVINLGMYIGMGGVVTFKNAKKAVEVIKDIPIERLVLETDCPYLSPVPFRGERNNSAMIKYVAEKIAEIKGITAHEVLSITSRNSFKVYEIE